MAVILVADPLGGMNAIQPDGGPVYTPSVEYYAGGFSISAWVRDTELAAPVAVWDFIITLDNGTTTSLVLVMQRTGDAITLTLTPYGGSNLVFFTYQDSPSPASAFHHICLSFSSTQVTAIADGVVLGPSKPLLPVEGVTAQLALYPMGAQYFDIVIHSKPLSNSTLLYYVQNLGEMNPPG